MHATSTIIGLGAVLLLFAYNSYASLATPQPVSRSFRGVDMQGYAVGTLPNVHFETPMSWAGQIRIPSSKDNELFFWLFQAEQLSNNLIIWLNGGPGCSSLDGLTKENGPISFRGNSSTPTPNPYSWAKLANVLYIDQPVGTGYSGGSTQATTNDQVSQNLYLWLQAFYDVFPDLKTHKLYIMGESYAGIYIPYSTKALVDNKDGLPLNIRSITIGDGTIGNIATQSDVVMSTWLHQQVKILDLPQDILNAFDTADKQCGFDGVISQLTYPPKGVAHIRGNPEGENVGFFNRNKKRQDSCFKKDPNTPALVNESVNTLCYGGSGCATFSTAANYLQQKQPCFSVYNIGYTCQNTPDLKGFAEWLNLPATREAIHAPNKTYEMCNATISAPLENKFVEPPSYKLLPEILDAEIKVNLYSGDYDFLINHYGTELVIQNMTWCGKQSFQERPAHPFTLHDKKVGIWGAERGLTYHHLLHAGHTVPYDIPEIAFAYVRDFVLNTTGYSTAIHLQQFPRTSLLRRRVRLKGRANGVVARLFGIDRFSLDYSLLRGNSSKFQAKLVVKRSGQSRLKMGRRLC